MIAVIDLVAIPINKHSMHAYLNAKTETKSFKISIYRLVLAKAWKADPIQLQMNLLIYAYFVNF